MITLGTIASTIFASKYHMRLDNPPTWRRCLYCQDIQKKYSTTIIASILLGSFLRIPNHQCAPMHHFETIISSIFNNKRNKKQLQTDHTWCSHLYEHQTWPVNKKLRKTNKLNNSHRHQTCSSLLPFAKSNNFHGSQASTNLGVSTWANLPNSFRKWLSSLWQECLSLMIRGQIWVENIWE